MLFAGCSTTTPISATSNPVGNKCGEVKTHRILGFGGFADLGIYTTIGVRVYGE